MKELLLVTDVSTTSHLHSQVTSAEVVEASGHQQQFFQFRSTLTITITLYELLILLGSNHLLGSVSNS